VVNELPSGAPTSLTLIGLALRVMAVTEYSKNLYLMGAMFLTAWIFTGVKETLSTTDPGD
jgi:hypothetical protein